MNKSFSQNALREGTASQAVERPLVRIRVCLQAYRKLLKMSPALGAVCVNNIFPQLLSRADGQTGLQPARSK